MLVGRAQLGAPAPLLAAVRYWGEKRVRRSLLSVARTERLIPLRSPLAFAGCYFQHELFLLVLFATFFQDLINLFHRATRNFIAIDLPTFRSCHYLLDCAN